MSKNNEFTISNSEKHYEEHIASLECQLKNTIEQFNIYQMQQSAYSNRLELQLKDARERLLEYQISKEAYQHQNSSFGSNEIETLTPATISSVEFIPEQKEITSLPLELQTFNQSSPSPSFESNPILISQLPNNSINELTHKIPLQTTTQKINEELLNRYIELEYTIKAMKADINEKIKQLEGVKNASKDKLTENIIELRSCQNSLQSLRSRKIMEQIKQTGKQTFSEEEDAFDKLKCMFSRTNAIVNNIDKQINKNLDKSKKLDEEISINKQELNTRQDEIDNLNCKCDELIAMKYNLEQELLNIGISIEQLNNSGCSMNLITPHAPRESKSEKNISVYISPV